MPTIDPGTFQSIGWLAVTLFAVAAGLEKLFGLTDRLKEKPPPGATYATKAELAEVKLQLTQQLERLNNQISTQRQEIREEYHELARSGEERTKSTHERINQVLKAVSEVQGQLRGRH